jgi:hypothetical protein
VIRLRFLFGKHLGRNGSEFIAKKGTVYHKKVRPGSVRLFWEAE